MPNFGEERMIEFFSDHYSDFLQFSVANPVAAGLAGVWVMGMLTFLLKVMPMRIWRFIVKHTTFDVSVDSSHMCFHDLIEWYAKKQKVERLRTLRLTSGQYGNDDDFVVSVGYGSHLFFHKKWPYIISRNKLESSGSEKQKEEISIKTFGRSQKRIISLIQDVKIVKKTENKKLLAFTYSVSWGGWEKLGVLKPRTLSSIILKEDKKEEIIKHLDNFKNSEEWYDQMGITHKTGILFHGPPGTGKSSLIKAIASEKQFDVYSLNLAGLTDEKLEDAFREVPEECIILIEDIDGTKAALDREKTEENSNTYQVTISGLLNALDGVCSGNHIVIATTNHLSKLDPAIIRPGRFDLVIELGYLDRDMFVQMMNKFFPDMENEINSIEINLDKMTPSFLENCVIRGDRDFHKTLELIKNGHSK